MNIEFIAWMTEKLSIAADDAFLIANSENSNASQYILWKHLTWWGSSFVVWTSGSAAQYVCDWTADQVQINQAIAAANTAWWGTVYILPWSYSLANYILPLSNVTVVCLWLVTLTMAGSTEMIANTSAIEYFIWEWWYFNHNNAGWADKQCIRIDWATDIYFRNVQTVNAAHHAIWLTDCHRFWVTDTYNSTVGITNALDWCGIVLFDSTDWIIKWNSTYNTWYHWIQCHNNCDRIIIEDNFVNDTGNVNTAWAGIQAQDTCSSIIVSRNVMRNVLSAGINLDAVTNSILSDNIIDSTTTTAWISLTTSCSGIDVTSNNIKNTNYWVKVNTGSKINITNNTVDSPTLNWIYVLWGTTLYWSISNNNLVWMAGWSTAGIQLEGAGTGNAVIANNFVQWARYVARFATGTAYCNLTGNYGKITSLSTYANWIRDDSGWATITVDASNTAYV